MKNKLNQIEITNQKDATFFCLIAVIQKGAFDLNFARALWDVFITLANRPSN